MPSNFALNIHALFCRPYLERRNWFDFFWYVARGVTANRDPLSAALRQKAPWAEQTDLEVDMDWVKSAFTAKVDAIAWPEAAEDVRRSLRPSEAKSLELWSAKSLHARAQDILDADQ